MSKRTRSGLPLEFDSHNKGFQIFGRWLADQGIEAVLVNPHLVKKYRENSDNTLTVEPDANSSQPSGEKIVGS